MEKAKNVLCRLTKAFMDLKLSKKLIIGYIFIIVIPTATLEFALYLQSSNMVIEKYVFTQQHALDAAIDNLDTQCRQIESITDLIQANSSIQSYISGENNSISNEIYSYIKDIHPVFSYCKNSNGHIKNITLYKYKATSLNLSSDIVDSRNFIGDIQVINSSKANSGLWQFSAHANKLFTLTYYKKVFDTSYSHSLGFVKIDLCVDDFFSSFSSLPEILYLRTNDGQIMRFDTGKLVDVSNKAEYKLTSNHIIQSVKYGKLNGTLIYMLNGKKNIVQNNGIFLCAILIIPFILLSIMYYGIVTSLSKRIIKLKNHIGRSKAEALTPYITKEYKDEIGALVLAYNEMIEKTNYLLHEIYRSKLQKKEADFYALQAQIKPHFLYNVLENIRMSAESNHDGETAQMVFTLGKYMRYNLAKNDVEVTLLKEIEHIKNYLDIYKMRLKGRLSVEISVFTEIDRVSCPRFILQPIVENSLCHGFPNGCGGTIKITVRAAPEFSAVLVKIEDNGVGICPERLEALNHMLHNNSTNASEDGEHVGLKNVFDRLVSFFGDSDLLSITSNLGEGTAVTIKMRVRNQNL
jgi:two-component system, sensor histidine kinase YesM